MPIPTILAVALGALVVTPPSVPAKGTQQAILTVDRTSMVHLSTVNPQGTACQVVDHLRGPFANSGEVGKKNCDLDLLLDAGVYKLRLTSPAKGKGSVTVKAEPFPEVNSPLLRLEPGRTVDGVLKPHQQASFWLHVDQRKFVPVRISGRTAGEVSLWKSGEWSESVGVRPRTAMPVPGRPIHEWWMTRALEPGDYLLTVYGTAAQKWTRGPEDDALSVSYLYDPLPPDLFAEAVLPAYGVLVWSAPKGRPAVTLSLTEAPSAPVDLQLSSLGSDLSGSLESGDGSCRIDAKALMPECSATGAQDTAHAVIVRGTPGVKVRVEWGRLVNSGPLADGDLLPSGAEFSFRAPANGKFLAGYQEQPSNPDEAPLSCALEVWRPGVAGTGHWEAVARDYLVIAPKTAIEHPFNYDGRSEHVLFEITSSGTYALSTSGERKNRCELYHQEPGGKLSRLTESTVAAGCSIERSLPAGLYELQLFEGDSGIETLRIGDTGKALFGLMQSGVEKVPGQKTGCLFNGVTLEKGALYRIDPNRSSLSHPRALALRALPLTLEHLVTVEVEPGRPLELPLAPGKPLLVAAASATGSGSPAIACALSGAATVEAKDGVCHLPEIGSPQSLTLTVRGPNPLAVRLSRPLPPPPAPPLQAWNPTFTPLPALALDSPAYFDFARSESHSLVFEVKEAGLYHLTTVGLLATSCEIRTPAAPKIAAEAQGGRGRNCLIADYLRPGRYLATATTTGQSRGRGGVVLTRRPSHPGPEVSADGQAFFRVDADALLTEKLSIGKGGRIRLNTIARGGALSCRLEDQDGWPVEPVPTPCSLTRDFDAGSYLWVQLPLTVESMRRTELERVLAAVVLVGGKPHEIGFNTWYSAKLGKSGKDEFFFDVPADLAVQLALTDAMQGRLYSVQANGALTPVEFIAPQNVPPAADQGAPAPGDEGGGEGMGMSEPGSPMADESGPPADANPDNPDDQGGPAPAAPSYAPPVAPVVTGPAGQSLQLAQGRYKLIAEHSREDVDVSYRIYLRSDTLAPGIAREVGAPGSYTVRVPSEGVLRLRTEGELDVRCRLFDAAGKLAAESSGFGDDWNCALAEPVKAGDYSLVIESETLQPGTTHVAVALPKLEALKPLAEGMAIKLTSSVATAPLPEVAGDVVQEVTLRSSGPTFSCDVSGKDGVIARTSNAQVCSFLLRPRGERFQLRTWTLEKQAEVQVHVAAKAVVPADGSKIPGAQAVVASVARDGRWRTGAGVFCLPESHKGALEPCGPEVSLESGPAVFAALGPKDAKLALEEVVFDAPESPASDKVRLGAKPWIELQKGSSGSLQLLRVTGLLGERSAPSCAMGPGARVVRDTDCFAASGLSGEAVARAWTAGEEGEADLARFAVKLPAEASPLVAGQQTLAWIQAQGRFAAPSAPARIDLTLAPETWAVQLDTSGKAIDLCPPEKDVARCVFAARGGELALFGEGEHKADATVILGETPARARMVAGLYEGGSRTPGVLIVDVPASDVVRHLEIEGARYCSVRLADGSRVAGCAATLPAKQAAELWIGHAGRPVRALAHVSDNFYDGIFPRALGSAAPPLSSLAPLAMGQAVPLVGSMVERTIVLDKPAVVHLRGDSGVCGVSDKSGLAVDGLGAGCEIHRLLEVGTHRLMVRPFAGQPLTGALSWTQTAVEPLGEGVGPERFLAAGQAQLFRFTLASAGRVGIGLQEPAETLECAVRDASSARLGEGCQQLLKLEPGSYLLEVRAPVGVRPTRFKPVVVGLSGAKMDVPAEYLRDFFQRIGGLP